MEDVKKLAVSCRRTAKVLTLSEETLSYSCLQQRY